MNKYEDFLSFGKENIEAMVQSSTLAAKGYEELVKAYAAYTGQAVDKTTQAIKALSAAKTPTEFFQIQAQISKESAESWMAESRKLAEIANTVITSSLEPLQARVKATASLAKAA